MFNDLFWFSMTVAALGSTTLAAVGIGLPAGPAAPDLGRPSGLTRPRGARRARRRLAP